jgi:uncharacterized protein YeaO (DUF488 family)
MIRTKSVHSPIEREGDGLRILATRYRGRGLPADRYDVWMANLGPSEALLKAVLAGDISWTEFKRRYKRELLEDADEPANPTIRNRGQKFTLRLIGALGRAGDVTLLCHCAENETHCHRHILKETIDRGA